MEVLPSQPRGFRFGVFELDLRAGELRKSGTRLKLAGQPIQVLQVLVEHPHEVVTREELRRRLWPDNTFVDYDLALNKAVARLRDTLGDAPENPRYIETIPRHGYRFIGVIEPANPPQPAGAPAATPAPAQISWRLYGAIAVLVFGMLALRFGARLTTHTFATADSNAVEVRSLAVLPLENLSKDSGQDYFSDGITEALTTELAQMSSLRVISRTSAARFKGTNDSLPEIGRKLGADAIVEGSVTRSESRVRVTAQLIDARSDRHLWAKTYERDLQDILQLQDEVARDIAGEIRLKLSPTERARLEGSQTVDTAAHDAYLRGRYFWNRRTEPELHKAKDYFEQAIAADPGFAPAYAGLADTYFYLSYAWGRMPPREGMPLAKAAALKAIELDDSAAEGHASLGTVKFLYDWDFPGAEKELKRAIAVNPNYELGHHAYSVLLAAEHRSAESVAEARKAVEVDPLSIPANNILGDVLQAAGSCDQALDVDKKSLDLEPNSPHLYMVYARMATCYSAIGKEKESLDAEAQARANEGASPNEIGLLFELYARSKRRALVEKELQAALARWDKNHWHADAFTVADAYANLGEMDKAFAWLDKCIELRSTELVWIYIRDNPFQHDSRFAEVKREMGILN